jgi:hypothetical protein
MPSIRSDDGQASVELVALIPLVAVLIGLMWQALLAGEAIWLSGGAARTAARAEALGTDPARAARSVLPARFRSGLRVQAQDDGSVTVELRIPVVLGGGTLASVTARAHFAAQR